MHPLGLFVKMLKLNRYGGVLATRLVKITGKSKESVHPKHLIKIEEPWYLEHIEKSDNVLDVGCDNGSHTIKCAEVCKMMIGFDYNENALKIARNQIKRNGIENIKIIKHDAESKFPFDKNQFDKVLFLDILEHINKRKFVLSQIKKVLKPGGLLILSIPNVDSSWKRLQKRVNLNPYADPDHKIEYTRNTINQELEINGFEILEIRPIVYDTPVAGIIDITGALSLTVYKKLLGWKKRMVKLRPNDTTGFRIIARPVKRK
jgi:2-polyprenyl-3-methyl-5-hydroxy-6-metoxy-1,4-benzoquinol methylase